MSPDVSLSYELRMLAYSAFLCLLLWVPYTLAAIQARGLGRVGLRLGAHWRHNHAQLPEVAGSVGLESDHDLRG